MKEGDEDSGVCGVALCVGLGFTVLYFLFLPRGLPLVIRHLSWPDYVEVFVDPDVLSI